MEDRETPVLYLEMTEATPDDYARDRVKDVLALPGSSGRRGGATSTATVPTFPASCPSSTPSGCTSATRRSSRRRRCRTHISGHHFLRTPRPGQGRLTGKPTVSLSLVLISPTTPDEAQALRDWGDFVHLNHIVEAGVPGFTMITPYENATRRRSALPALLRVRRPRRRDHVQADASTGRGAPRRVGARRSARRGRCTPRCASRTSTRSRGSARLPDCLRSHGRLRGKGRAWKSLDVQRWSLRVVKTFVSRRHSKTDETAWGYLLGDQGGIPRTCCSLRRWSQP